MRSSSQVGISHLNFLSAPDKSFCDLQISIDSSAQNVLYKFTTLGVFFNVSLTFTRNSLQATLAANADRLRTAINQQFIASDYPFKLQIKVNYDNHGIEHGLMVINSLEELTTLFDQLASELVAYHNNLHSCACRII